MSEGPAPEPPPPGRRIPVSNVLLALLLAALAFNQLRFVGMPLLWNDEAHTVMTGKFTLEYGYPRVTDGRNIVFADHIVDGVYQNFDEDLKATTQSVWLGYYYAAFAVWLADFATDPYTKTTVLRACFALVGLLGVLLFWRGVVWRLRGSGDERVFGLAFLALTLLSVTLVLHLKEVRYYALVFFQGGALVYLYARWRSELARFPLRFFVAITACLVAAYLTFYPVYFIFFGTLGLVEAVVLLAALLPTGKGEGLAARFRAGLIDGLRAASPVLLSFLLVLPTFGYFDPFGKAEGTIPWSKNLGTVFDFLVRYEFLTPVLVLGALTVALLVRAGLAGTLRAELRDPRLSTAGFLTIAFLFYAGVITRIPAPASVLTRYYILLIPLLSAVGILLALWLRSQLRERPGGRRLGLVVGILVATSVLPDLGPKLESWYGRSLELRRPYRGPLDFAIPYLLKRFDGDTRDLVLATNYEEPSFMYYLDCKVTIGYKANNVKDDLRYVPDVIVYRAWWRNYEDLFDAMLKQHTYDPVVFPVVDYPVNNLPQFDGPVPHQYRTRLTANDAKKLKIHIRRQ